MEEGGVEGGAGFDQEAEALAIGEEGKEGGQREVAGGTGGEGDDFELAGRGGVEGGAAGLDGGIGECGLGAEEEEIGCGRFGGGAEELAGGWGAELGVEDDAEEWAAARQGGAVGEGGVVGEDCADSGEDGVGGVAEAVDLGAGERAGEPDGCGGGAGCGWRCEIAVDRERGFESDEGALVLDELGERQVERAGAPLAGAERDGDAGVAENGEAAATDERVGVRSGDDHAGDAGMGEGNGAGAGAAVVGAGL